MTGGFQGGIISVAPGVAPGQGLMPAGEVRAELADQGLAQGMVGGDEVLASLF
jgi:hypothetical protein